MSEGSSENTEPKAIPRRIEPRKFANKHVKLQGSVDRDALVRLAQAVERVGSVRAELQFGQTEDYKHFIEGTVAAEVQRACQRCLNSLDTQISGDIRLILVRDEEQAERLPSEYDPWIVVEDEADLYEILEEELLLNLPLIVTHEKACVGEDKFTSGDKNMPQEEKSSPFDVLKQMKTKPQK